MFEHFTHIGLARSSAQLANRIHPHGMSLWSGLPHRRGFRFQRLHPTPAETTGITVTDSLNCGFATTHGQVSLDNRLSSLTVASLDVSTHTTEVTLIADGPNGVGAIIKGSAEPSLADTLNLVLSLTSILPFVYASTLTHFNIHHMRGPISPRFFRVYRVPKSCKRKKKYFPPNSTRTPPPMSIAPASSSN
jgi:hypothetical protein